MMDDNARNMSEEERRQYMAHMQRQVPLTLSPYSRLVARQACATHLAPDAPDYSAEGYDDDLMAITDSDIYFTAEWEKQSRECGQVPQSIIDARRNKREELIEKQSNERHERNMARYPDYSEDGLMDISVGGKPEPIDEFDISTQPTILGQKPLYIGTIRKQGGGGSR